MTDITTSFFCKKKHCTGCSLNIKPFRSFHILNYGSVSRCAGLMRHFSRCQCSYLYPPEGSSRSITSISGRFSKNQTFWGKKQYLMNNRYIICGPWDLFWFGFEIVDLRLKKVLIIIELWFSKKGYVQKLFRKIY